MKKKEEEQEQVETDEEDDEWLKSIFLFSSVFSFFSYFKSVNDYECFNGYTQCWVLTLKKHINEKKNLEKNNKKKSRIKMSFGWMIKEIKSFSFD